MKKRCVAIVFVLMLLVSFAADAQTVGYTYKPLAAEGCSVQYSVAKHCGKFYIIVTVSSDRMRFTDESSMMVRTSDGNVLKFSGELIDNSATPLVGIITGDVAIPITSILSIAQFEVLPDQFELLKDGIIKVRLSTIPIEHEREFKKDKIGKKLYKFYTDVKNKKTDF